jgi:putative ABC transport system substrate-binding protein
MNKKILIGLVVILLLIAGAYFFLMPKTEEEPQEIYRVGMLSGLSYAAEAADGFKAGMAELGYIEGQNIVYDLQETDFDMAMYRSVLNEFVEDEVDLIFVFPTEASQEAKAATQGTGIPVVFTIANIEDTGLIESIAVPGGNMTGVRYPGPDIALQRFEIMRELAPEAKRYWIPYQRGYPIVASQLEALRKAAEPAGITLIEAPADNAAEVQTLLDERDESADIGIDVILSLAEPLYVTPDAFLAICEFAAEHAIPNAGALIEVEGCGSLFGVHIHNFNTGKQVAPLADKILKGIPAGTISVVSAEPYFQFNYKVAQEMGLEVPQGLLERADEIIQ